MMSHDYAHNGNSRPATLSGNFTADEVARLSNLRRNFHSHADYLRRVLDDRRLEFARWLLENGKLDDECQDGRE
jgi:hypothetical protein